MKCCVGPCKSETTMTHGGRNWCLDHWNMWFDFRWCEKCNKERDPTLDHCDKCKARDD